MASQPSRAIAKQLEDCRITISNTLNDQDILSRVATRGYTSIKMQEGRQMYDTAINAINAYAAASGARRSATERAEDAMKDARNYYRSVAQTARTVFGRKSSMLDTLQLSGRTPATNAAFINVANQLYDNALADEGIIVALAEYGYDAAQLMNGKQKLITLQEAREAQVKAKSVVIEANRKRKVAIAALQKWIKRYRAIAILAFEDDPQLAERIGVAVRTSPAASPRRTPQQAPGAQARPTPTEQAPTPSPTTPVPVNGNGHMDSGYVVSVKAPTES